MISFFCYLQHSLLAELRLVLAYEKPSGKVLQLQRQKYEVMEIKLRSRVGGTGAGVPGLRWLHAAGGLSCHSASVPRGPAGLAQPLAILHPEQEH